MWLRMDDDIPITPPYAFIAWAGTILSIRNRILLVLVVHYVVNY
jgi:hypothetical protein